MLKPLTKEQQKFATENHNLIYGFLNHYRLPNDEWYDIAAIGYVKAVSTYNSDKGTFSSYAFFVMKREVFMEKRKPHAQRRQALVLSLDSPMYINENGEEISYAESVGSSDNFYNLVDTTDTIKNCKSLTKRQKQIINHLKEGQNAREIGEVLNVSRAYISKQVKEIREKLYREF